VTPIRCPGSSEPASRREVVLHDEAVSPEVLELVSASAQVRNVDRLIENEAVSRDKSCLS